MYIPNHFAETRLDVLHSFIESHPFAPLVTLGTQALAVNHIPFKLDRTRGEFGTLRAHVARANDVRQQFSATVESVVIFQGPHAYISPSWYPSKHQHGKAVPTWNYAVVHAHGLPKPIEDKAWLLNLVTELSHDHEAAQALPWKVADAPPDYIDRLLDMIVGIEMPIAKLEGKWKLHQNKPHADRLGVIAGLQAKNQEQPTVADLMQRSMQELNGK